MSRMQFLNTYIDNLTMDEAIKTAENLIKNNAQSYVVTPNIDHIVMLETDAVFRDVYHNASLIITDGQPMIWISKMLGTPIVEKVSGSDFFPRICELAAQKGYSVFILGAAEGVGKMAAQNLCLKYAGLKIVGVCSPEYGFEQSKEKVEKIINMVQSAKPDILAVALGSPKGEKLIYYYKKELNVPLSMQIGATIDFQAGNVRRAPKFMSKMGLEWLFRVFQDPKRLGKRYWNDARKIVTIVRKYRKK